MHLNKIFSLVALSAACSGTPPATEPDVLEPPAAPVARSARGNLRFKGPERINADFAAALELPADSLCLELGQYACTTVVHNVALGGVDPYGPGLYEAPGVTATTTPLVVERIAWAACGKRVELDLADAGKAVLFRGIPLDGKKLASPDGAEVRSGIIEVTQRILLRKPYRTEVERYVKLARDSEATGTPEPARAFLQSLCFAVLSSTESVFY